MTDKHTRQRYQTRYKTCGRRHAVSPSLPLLYLRAPTPAPRAAPGSRFLRPSSTPPRRTAPSAAGTRLRLGLARLVLLLRPSRPVPETRASFRMCRPVLLRFRIWLGPSRGVIPEPRPRSLPRAVPILGPPVPISQTRSLAGLPRTVFICLGAPASLSRAVLLGLSPAYALPPKLRPRVTLPGPVLLLVRPLPQPLTVARPGLTLCRPLPALTPAPGSLSGAGPSPEPPPPAGLLSPIRLIAVERGPGLSLHGPFLLARRAVAAIRVLGRAAPEASPGQFASVLLPALRPWTAISDGHTDTPSSRTSVKGGMTYGVRLAAHRHPPAGLRTRGPNALDAPGLLDDYRPRQLRVLTFGRDQARAAGPMAAQGEEKKQLSKAHLHGNSGPWPLCSGTGRGRSSAAPFSGSGSPRRGTRPGVRRSRWCLSWYLGWGSRRWRRWHRGRGWCRQVGRRGRRWRRGRRPRGRRRASSWVVVGRIS